MVTKWSRNGHEGRLKRFMKSLLCKDEIRNIHKERIRRGEKDPLVRSLHPPLACASKYCFAKLVRFEYLMILTKKIFFAVLRMTSNSYIK